MKIKNLRCWRLCSKSRSTANVRKCPTAKLQNDQDPNICSTHGRSMDRRRSCPPWLRIGKYQYGQHDKYRYDHQLIDVLTLAQRVGTPSSLSMTRLFAGWTRWIIFLSVIFSSSFTSGLFCERDCREGVTASTPCQPPLPHRVLRHRWMVCQGCLSWISGLVQVNI